MSWWFVYVVCCLCRNLRAFWGDQTDPKSACGGPNSILRTRCDDYGSDDNDNGDEDENGDEEENGDEDENGDDEGSDDNEDGVNYSDDDGYDDLEYDGDDHSRGLFNVP